MASKNLGQRRAIEGVIDGTNYLALFVRGTEISVTEYARQPITMWEPSTSATAQDTNVDYNLGQAISFPTLTESWGTIDAIALYDSADGGEMLFDEPITPFTPVVGNLVQFPREVITLSIR